jgi:molecular chaperone DnaK
MVRRQPIGIDLGTTNSVAAALVEGRPQILEDSHGHSRVPSVVAFKDWDFVVGEAAKDLILTHPKTTVYGVKRLMGRRFDSREAADAKRRMAYRIEEASDGGILVGLGEHNFTPVDISAVILKAVRENAERILQAEVTEAVITIPAHFTHAQRNATLEAAKLAGLKCDRLIHEPTAAALAYAYEKPEAKTFLVFDLGGGTFDVTILKYEGKAYEVLATYGDTYLGGEDFDFRIVDHLARRFADKHDLDPWADRLAIQRLKKFAEAIKSELSFRTEIDISLPGFANGKDLNDTLTRATLEELVSDLVFRTIQIAGGTVTDAGLKHSEIDEVILVGGQTRMPLIREGLRSLFDREPSQKVNPDQVVAIGAAAHAAKLHDPGLDTSVFIDVIPYAMGIEVAAGAFQPIFGKYERVPCQHTRSFVTQKDNQETIAFVVRQGNSMKAAENEFLAQYIVRGIPPAPRMGAQVEATFRLDENVRVHVSAKDKATGRELPVEVRNYAQMRAAVAQAVAEREASKKELTGPVNQMAKPRTVVTRPEVAKTEPMRRPSKWRRFLLWFARWTRSIAESTRDR